MDPYIQSLVREHTQFFRELLKGPHRDWVSSVTNYTGIANLNINAGLRGDDLLTPESEAHIDNIDSVFDLIPPITQQITLFRGVKQREYTAYRGGYVSATYVIEATARFVNFFSKCCLIEFNVLPGSKVLSVESISGMSFEKEFILDRRGTFNLTGVVENYDSPLGIFDKYLFTYMPHTSAPVLTPISVPLLPPLPPLESPVLAPVSVPLLPSSAPPVLAPVSVPLLPPSPSSPPLPPLSSLPPALAPFMVPYPPPPPRVDALLRRQRDLSDESEDSQPKRPRNF